MQSLLERSLAASARRLILLAPARSALPAVFQNVTVDAELHARWLHDTQRLRGAIYLREGNVSADQLSLDGRHCMPEDRESWHLLMTDRTGEISACALYLPHSNTVAFESLRVHDCPLAQNEQWRDLLKCAVESDLDEARQAGLRYVELGGWAIRKDRRGTPDGLVMALTMHALGLSFGGALGIATANRAHSCSSILRRLGGSSLGCKGMTLPSYFDPRYNANLELLRFDSRQSDMNHATLVNVATSSLVQMRLMVESL